MGKVMSPEQSEQVLHEFLQHPAAARWVEQRLLPGEQVPRSVLTADGLIAFGQELVRHSPLGALERRAVYLALWDLGRAAGVPVGPPPRIPRVLGP